MHDSVSAYQYLMYLFKTSAIGIISLCFLKFFLMFIYHWERETEQEWGRGRERGRHRIWSRPQAPSYEHRARHRAQTHKLWDHDLSQSRTCNLLSHSGAPLIMLLTCISFTVNDIEHLLMCLFAICISSLVKCLFMPFAYFLLGFFFTVKS